MNHANNMNKVDAPGKSLSHDVAVISLVGAAHFTSHFFQLAVPALFAILRNDLGVSYTKLGLIPTLFFLSSGICQALVGEVVDRYGARLVLLIGMTLLALSTLLAAFAPNYEVFLPLAVIGGIGNSVFHPCDLSILTHKVSSARMGRAFGAHQLGGMLGYAAAPALMLGGALLVGWRTYIFMAGVAGLAMVLALWLAGERLATPAGMKAGGSVAPPTWAELFARNAILMAFVYFLLSSLSSAAIQTFGIPALSEMYDIGIDRASAALTIFLLASAVGIAAGGVLADRTNRHHIVAGYGIVIAALLMIVVAWGGLPVTWAVAVFGAAAFASGATAPSRDLMVRQATPMNSYGKTFGFVYSGLDLGSTLAPIIFGMMIDNHMPHAVFVGVAIFWSLTIISIVQVRKGRIITTGEPAHE